jgi:hypothetical protein
MAFRIRLDKKTELLLEKAASILKTSKNQVIKQSLLNYCPRVLIERRRRPYELIKDLLGKEGSGRADLSVISSSRMRGAWSEGVGFLRLLGQRSTSMCLIFSNKGSVHRI